MTADPGRHLLDKASLGEVAWLDVAGHPRATGVLPLVREDRPVLALTLDRADLATQLASAEVVDLVVREPRNTSPGWRSAGWRCRSRLVEDLEGQLWLDELRLQELRRYPPARRYADSPLLCREHWWYLPRLLVDLDPVEPLDPPPARRDVDDLLLVTARSGLPVTGGVTADATGCRPTWGPPPATGPGTVLGQDASFPDLEVWQCWTRSVEVVATEVVPLEQLPQPEPLRTLGLRERWRRERRFARECRRGIDAWTA